MTETLPARWYHDPEVFRRERAAIFDSQWLIAGHESAIPSPSGALSVTVGGRPILLVRKADGQLRAYHNVCRHRAAPLLWDGQAEPCTALRCRYHGWRYSLDGALQAAPGYGAPPPQDMTLFPVHLRLWKGILFVSCAETPPPIEPVLDPLIPAAEALPLQNLTVQRTARHRLQCNWKTYVENYLEGYHIPWLHPSLTRQVNMRDYQVQVQGRTALHRVSARDGAINQGLWIWLWPNAALNVYESACNIEIMNPVSPDEMEIQYFYLFPPDHPGAAQDDTVAMSQEVTEEDIQICEAVQRNLSAGIYDTGRLSPRHEGGVAAFQAWVREALQ